MRQFWTASILLSTALSASAATLGRHSGAVVVGRPLDVQVQVLLAAGEDLSSLCFSADVFYGDTRLAAGLVDITPVSGAASPTLRVRTRQPVNEPFVTLTVTAGCSGGFSRRYTMLADMVSEPAAVSAAPVASVPPAVASVAPGSEQPPIAPAAPPDRQGAASPGATKPAKAARAPKARAESSRQVARRPEAPTAPPNGPRLKLEPLEVAIERDPTLRLSSEITSAQGAGDEARAQARDLWQAINASPEDVLKRSQDLGVLSAEVKSLREAKVLADARQVALENELQHAQQARYRNPLVYGLAGGLLAALLGIWFVWRRTAEESTPKAWWAEGEGSPMDAKASRRSALEEARHPARSSASRAAYAVTTDREDGPRSLPSTPFQKSVAAASERRDFAASALGNNRSVATEELFDVQQQADFFVSLGEDEQAIRVLRNHLLESHEPSAMAYLDLFKLYHKLDRRDDYEALRDEFNRVFNAGAPPFERYADQGRGLDAYEAAFGRIQALWPQPRVLDLIERSIFRDDQDERTEVFDLEAYRELLLLHAMAKDIIQRGSSSAKPEATGGFSHTAMQPLKLGSANQGASFADAGAMVPPASSSLGLDIDLDELDQQPEFQPSMPVISPPEEAVKRANAPGVHAVEPPASMSNWLDFEVVDFELPVNKAEDGPSSNGDNKSAHGAQGDSRG